MALGGLQPKGWELLLYDIRTSTHLEKTKNESLLHVCIKLKSVLTHCPSVQIVSLSIIIQAVLLNVEPATTARQSSSD